MSEIEPNQQPTDASSSSSAGPQTPGGVPPGGPGPLPPQTQIGPPPRKSRTGMFLFGAFTGCLLLVVGFFFMMVAFATTRSDTSQFTFSTQRVAVVPIDGPILEARETVESLDDYAESATVKAIVVRINSPGGAIAPSQEIYSEIRRIREETGKPVVASFDSVAASGGFYIAAACDQIVANPGSITGSIGVILQWLEYEQLIRWARMRPETITSGAMKSAGSPLQQLTEEERKYLQQVVNQLHTQFVRAVAAGREGKLSEAEVARLADGRVFTGEEALSLKLVDRLGTLHDAVRLAGEMAGIKGEPAMVYPKPRRPNLIDLLSEASNPQSLLEKLTSRRAARFLYMWEAAGAASAK